MTLKYPQIWGIVNGGEGGIEMDLHIKKILVPGKTIVKDDESQSHFYQNAVIKTESESLPSSYSGAIRRPAPLSYLHPPAKRIRLEEKEIPADQNKMKKLILQWKKSKLEYITQSYNNHLLELFFLDHDGNLVDMQSVLNKPTPELASFVRKRKLDQDFTLETYLLGYSPSSNFLTKVKEEPQVSSGLLSKVSSPIVSKPSKKYLSSVKHKLQGMSDDSSLKNSQQAQMVEKAKQEAYIIQRISTLRKDGLWSEKRLPKVQEPSRPKAHWDYLLEEMVWLSADFAQERKWKKAAAKKCAKMVQKYFQDKALQAQKAEKEQEMKLRKIAAFVAKEVRTFWGNVGKLIEFKVNARLEEKKKQALDQHLSFIVDQTEKYSSMLAESMKKNEVVPVVVPVVKSSPEENLESPVAESDDEFKPDESSSDDEDTIAKEDDNPDEQASEIKLLQEESEQTLEDLLKELPSDYFEYKDIPETGQCPSPESLTSSSSAKDSQPKKEIKDKDFVANESEEDDEQTIEEQETKEQSEDYKMELEELEAENEVSVEELRKKYEDLAANSEPVPEDGTDESNDEEEIPSVQSESEMECKEDDDQSMISQDEEHTLGLEDLLDQSFNENQTVESKERSEKADKELKDAAAVAESLQPKGFTLSSTTVTTPIPFLLKHTLREYQHVGLDWLVTMYEKKLNGILADEMGLGKTIQTIALLAHLACEKEVWGPHLIVVPTSVMLNWEMEFKKWCPAFKILTYYGSQKERKLKRQGWTKENAFHVCITSYKLVIQDHQSFRRKKWRYFILDEAQNIKNFKSQRWQLLLNFQSSRRLLLTGTPLQNNLMELWSLMHFLMPTIFASHREFREWFSNPVTGMIEGNKEYNDSIIKRLHKVLRPFILRRLKSEVEQQMPKKYEHIVICRLSKRQRFLYEEFMSRTKTKDTLASGNFLSVINILMQLRKVCNHPNLFEPRPTVSPFMTEGITYSAPSLVCGITDYDPFQHVDLFSLNLLLNELERCLTAFAAHRIRKFEAPRKLIQEIDSVQEPPPKCPAGKIKLHVRPSSQPIPRPSPVLAGQRAAAPSVVTLKPVTNAAPSQPPSVNSSPQMQPGVRFQLVQHGGAYKAIPLPPGTPGGMIVQQTPSGPKLVMPQRTIQTALAAGTTANVGSGAPTGTTHPGLQIVQTSSGQYLLTSAAVSKPASSVASNVVNNPTMALLQRLQGLKGLQGSVITTGAGGRPVLRLPSATFRPSVQTATLANASSPTNLAIQRPLTQVTAQITTPNCTVSKAPLSNSVNSTPVTTTKPQKETEPIKRKEDSPKKSVFYLGNLMEERKQKRKEKLDFLAMLNRRRCHAFPIYGGDLMEAVTVLLGTIPQAATARGSSCGQGLVNCYNAITNDVHQFWHQTETLSAIVHTPIQCLDKMRDVTDRFVFCVPSVVAPKISMRTCHPHPSTLWRAQCQENIIRKEISKPLAPLHSILNASVTQFPDPRLIQYDCGKLQTLDRLLRRLKTEGHRVLIFTQMTKMLDIFEAFLNFHGHLYLRLDGSTKIDQRQSLMERFNQDKRIFVFILSTRSGGVGVNLTGADTVIFYDSDWNPTMDAQAQDRCHRIGQTRDVHIYRLISEKTIEENILKKANQKRLLGDLAIEGGNFTTASLKSNTIHDLFKVDVNEQDATKRMQEVLDKEKTMEETSEKDKIKDFENALAAAEDETDVEATKTAKAEAAAELAEFDENIPIEDQEGEEISKAEMEVAQLMKQLTPIEKYAMQFLEESDEGLSAEAERLAAEIEQQKKEWEQGRLLALKVEEDRLRHEENDERLVYSSSDSRNQIWITEESKDFMPIWRPPTPPIEENDFYMDPCMVRYKSSPIPETALPPVYVKRENNKRMKLETSKSLPLDQLPPSIRGPVRVKREDGSFAPKSLFDRRDPKRDFKRIPLVNRIPQPIIGKSTYSDAVADWLIHEDWTIVQAIHKVLQLPLSLSTQSSGHTPNWDLVADLVNSCSICFRSVRQCRNRYETVLVQREENKEAIVPEMFCKKLKKNKTGSTGIKPLQNTRGLSSYQLYHQDNNSKFSSLSSTRFETLKSITVKKKPTMKPMHVNPASKNSKHSQMMSDNGIQYEDPLNPAQVALNQAERLREKQKSQAEVTQQQQRIQQSQISVSQLQRHLQSQLVPQQQVAVVAASGGSAIQASPGGSGKVATSVILNQVTNNSSTTTSTVTTTTTILSGVRPVTQSGRTTLTLQDIQGRTGTTQATVVSVASLSHLQAAKLTAASLSSQGTQQRALTGVPVQTRTLLPQQMQYLRQRQTLALQPNKVVATSTSGDQQAIKRVQIASQTGATQKVQVAVSAGGVPGITAIQMVKPGSVVAGTSGASGGGAKTVTRTVTESEMSMLLRRQPQQFQKVGQIAQLRMMLAKQRSLVGVKGATVGVQLGNKGGGMVQILQGSAAQKHVTMQQVFKQVSQPQTVTQKSTLGTAVAKGVGTVSGAMTSVSGSALQNVQPTKLIPVSVSTQQPIKQTIQVVSAGSSGVTTSGIRVTAADRSALTVQGSALRVTNPPIFSAALQGQPITVAAKNQNSIRIQTTSVSTASQLDLPPTTTSS